MKLAEILTGPETWQAKGWGQGQRRCLVNALHTLLQGADGPIAWEIDRLIAVIEATTGRPVPTVTSPDGQTHKKSVARWNDQATWDEAQAVVDAYDRDRMLNP